MIFLSPVSFRNKIILNEHSITTKTEPIFSANKLREMCVVATLLLHELDFFAQKWCVQFWFDRVLWSNLINRICFVKIFVCFLLKFQWFCKECSQGLCFIAVGRSKFSDNSFAWKTIFRNFSNIWFGEYISRKYDITCRWRRCSGTRWWSSCCVNMNENKRINISPALCIRWTVTLPSCLLRSIAFRISSASKASAVAFISASAALTPSSPVNVSRLCVGSSFSGKKFVSVPVVPIRRTLCCKSIVHWCRFSISKPSNMSIVWSSSTEKLVTKISFSISTWATCTRPMIFCTPTPLAMPAHLHASINRIESN